MHIKRPWDKLRVLRKGMKKPKLDSHPGGSTVMLLNKQIRKTLILSHLTPPIHDLYCNYDMYIRSYWWNHLSFTPSFEKLLYKFCASADVSSEAYSVNCKQNWLGQSSEWLSRRSQPNSGPEGLSPRPGLISRIRPRGNQLVRLLGLLVGHSLYIYVYI